MDSASIYTIIITILTVFGSASAWRFYEKRASKKEQSDNFLKDDCRERITKLEILLEKASQEKDLMRLEILKLTGEVSELRVKVEFLEKENEELVAKKQSHPRKINKKRLIQE